MEKSIRPGSKKKEEEALARFRFDQLSHNLDYATGRENNYSSKFVELEIQIASIISSAIGISALLNEGKIDKVFVAGSLVLLVSLIFGLLAIHELKKFWNERMRNSRLIYNIWRSFVLEGGDYAQASKDADKVAGMYGIIESPNWTHYCQTTFLILGALILTGRVIHLVFLVQG